MQKTTVSLAVFSAFALTAFASDKPFKPNGWLPRRQIKLEVSQDGNCGYNSDEAISYTCQSSSFGSCCSADRICGSDTISCGTGCQPSYGLCDAIIPTFGNSSLGGYTTTAAPTTLSTTRAPFPVVNTTSTSSNAPSTSGGNRSGGAQSTSNGSNYTTAAPTLFTTSSVRPNVTSMPMFTNGSITSVPVTIMPTSTSSNATGPGPTTLKNTTHPTTMSTTTRTTTSKIIGTITIGSLSTTVSGLGPSNGLRSGSEICWLTTTVVPVTVGNWSALAIATKV